MRTTIQTGASDYSLLSVIVPAYNEEGGITDVVTNLSETLPGCDIIVIDDASNDATAEKVAAFDNVSLLRLPYNHGYGAALRRGIAMAKGDLIAWFDADNEHSAADLLAMVNRLNADKLGAVLGERRGSVSNSRSLGKLTIRILAVTLGLGYIRDFNCGLRVFRREVLLGILPLLPSGYSASTTSTFLMVKSRTPYAFHPITLGKRVGTSKVRLLDGFRTLVNIVRIASLLRPLQLFGSIAAVFAATGIVYSLILLLVNNQGLPALGVVLLIAALLILGIGLLADQISQFRMQYGVSAALSDATRRHIGNDHE